jgi:hypothetical protein
MSRIWDLLRDVERNENNHRTKDTQPTRCTPVPDRRSTKRSSAHTPVFVYGYVADDDPFHEGSEALEVSSRGGLITLGTAVEPGQTLLLINKVNQKEQKCNVVRQALAYLNRTAIVVEFPHPVPDFWDTTQP